MVKATMIGLDIAKQVFEVHGADKNFRMCHPASDQLPLAIQIYYRCRSALLPNVPKSHHDPRQGWRHRISCRSTRS